MTKKHLETVNAETLLDMRIEPIRFCVDTLIPQGVSLFGGAPKVGKSWLMLDLCIHVAAGLPMWNLEIVPGTVLYLCLEDTLSRIQDRLNKITDASVEKLYLAPSACNVADGLCQQIQDFQSEHPDLTLVVIDTFQLIRSPVMDSTYGTDYAEIRCIKAMADSLGISVLLVHHLRKQKDGDPFNNLSGTTGLTGAVDASFVLEKGKRSNDTATLFCTGRDILYREMELRFSEKNCVWELVSDSMEAPEKLLPKELEALVRLMMEQKEYQGSNTELAQLISSAVETEITPKALKQQMNKFRFQLENCGVLFESYRSNGTRYVRLSFSASDASDGKDAEIPGAEICVTCDPSDPETADSIEE